MENKQLNSAESLELIGRMMNQTQRNFERGSGVPFLVWGYTTVIISLAVIILLTTTGNPDFNWLWWAIPIIGYPLMMILSRKKERPVRTFIDGFVSNIWIAIGTASTLIPIVLIVAEQSNLIIPIEAVVLAIGMIITGLTIKLKVLTVAGFLSLLLSMAMFLFHGAYTAELFITMFIVGMIIPGHIINYKSRRCLKN